MVRNPNRPRETRANTKSTSWPHRLRCCVLERSRRTESSCPPRMRTCSARIGCSWSSPRSFGSVLVSTAGSRASPVAVAKTLLGTPCSYPSATPPWSRQTFQPGTVHTPLLLPLRRRRRNTAPQNKTCTRSGLSSPLDRSSDRPRTRCSRSRFPPLHGQCIFPRRTTCTLRLRSWRPRPNHAFHALSLIHI